MKIGVADYGMNVWDSGVFDYEQRWIELMEIGYQGVERLHAHTPDEAITKAARMRRLGLDFATCLAPKPELSIQWTAALGKQYVWIAVKGNDFNTFCRQVNIQAQACARWVISVALHNHLGSLVETQEQLETFLHRCPQCMLVLDTGHLAAANGDALIIAQKYTDRIAALHLKDWLVKDRNAAVWYEQGRFCELGAGNIGLDNRLILDEAVKRGYDGWVFIEHDTHLQEPLTDLSISRQYLTKAGY